MVKLATNIIDSHLVNISNNELLRNSFSNSAKVASVRPIFQKVDWTNIKIIDQLVFEIVFKRKFFNEKLLRSENHFLPDFISAYRKG